jgi:hypothetical protein
MPLNLAKAVSVNSSSMGMNHSEWKLRKGKLPHDKKNRESRHTLNGVGD